MFPDQGQLIPATLQAARLSRGMSLSTLSKQSGVSTTTLSRLENGRREATGAESESIARALDIPLAALFRRLLSDRLGLSGFYHRKLSRAGAKAVNQIENQCLLDVVAIRELVGMVDLPCPDSVPTIQLDEVKGDPEKAANMLRMKWGIPRGPIANIFETVERAGCIVIHFDFGIPEMDAMYQKAPGVQPIFWVNSRKPLERVRFSVAHELGHLVLHEEEPVDDGLAERQADAFAAAFLMPRADFRGECPAYVGIPQLVEMKRRWRCSMSAIVRRARDVGRVNERQYKNAMIRMSKEGWGKNEPYPISGESPSLLANAVRSCLDLCGFREDELAERLAVNLEQIRSWQQPFVGQRPTGEPTIRLANGY